MYYIGIDLSMRFTGLAVVDEREVLVESSTISTQSPAKQPAKQRAKRLLTITNSIMCAVNSYQPCLIAIEGHSRGSMKKNQQGTGDRMELYGAVIAALELAEQDFVEVPPKSLKKWFTGNGNADKDHMGEEALKRGYDLRAYRKVLKVWDYEEKNNEVDALALALWRKQDK